MNIDKGKGFTLIELMLVMAIAAVIISLKMQDDKLEMAQLESRKLGATQLFVYNMGVQKHVSAIAGVIPDPTDYPKVYTGVNWLKNDQCSNPALPETPGYLPCSFLENTGGKTTMGSMSFVTTIDYDSSSGYTARTVLSKMAGTSPGETNSGVLGMAALVASGAFLGSEGGSNGSIIYCPDISPMPAGMASICGLERDQIVMIVNTDGRNDHWLRVDHGNLMQHAIEMSDTAGATPAMDSDLASVHPNMRQIRNVARIYNVGAGSENIYIGSRLGAVAESGQAGSPTTLADNAVIIDADQEVLGFFKVQGDVNVTGGNIDLDSAGDPAKGNLNIEKDITSTAGNATINGWIRAETGNIVSQSGNVVSLSGDLLASQGIVRSQRFVDSNNAGYYMDPSSTSNIGSAHVRGRLNMLGSAYVGIVRNEGSSCSPNGSLARTSSGKLLSCVSGSWRGGGGRLVVTSPFAVGRTGTNTSGRPMFIQGYSPGTSDNAYAYLTICGRRVNNTDSVIGTGGWSRMAGISGIVPHGCSWNLTINGYNTTRTVYRYGQYMYIQ